MKLFLLPLLALAANAAPQYLQTVPVYVDQTSATTSSLSRQVGLSSVSSHEKTVSNGHSSVHRHQTHVNNPTTVIRRRRPVAVTRTVAAAPAYGSAAATTTIAEPTVIAERTIEPQQTIIQSADGRFFLSNRLAQQFQPGQFFQTADGRIFTFANSASRTNQVAVAEEEVADDDAAIIEDSFAVADAARSNAQEEQEEEEESVEMVARNNVAAAASNNNNANAFTRTFVTAPLTVNNARFISANNAQHVISSPAAVRTVVSPVGHEIVRSTVAHSPLVHAVPQQTIVRAASPVAHHVSHVSPSTVAVRTQPIGFSLADTVSNGFFFYDNAGIAYEF